MRRAAALAVLLVLGFLASTAFAGRSAVSQPLTSVLPPISTTLPVSTTLPHITTTLPVTTTIPKVTTTIPKVTTGLPVTTVPPKVTTLPNVTTTANATTTAKATTPSAGTTGLPKTAASTVAAASTTGVAGVGSGSSVGAAAVLSGPSSVSGSASSSVASAGLFAGTAGGQPAVSVAVTHLRAPRPFLSLRGPKAQRSAILVFRLRHAARVRFMVVQVFPLCRVVGSFTVPGHTGVNRFRFNGRVHGKNLPSGTYQIGLRTKRGRLLRVTIALFDRPVTSPSAIATARRKNVCGATLAFSPFPGSTLRPPIDAGSATAAAISTKSSPSRVLGLDITAPRNFVEDIGKNPFALAALALAVLLLAFAAIPEAATPRNRTTDLLVRERFALMLGGAAALAVGVMILALT